MAGVTDGAAVVQTTPERVYRAVADARIAGWVAEVEASDDVEFQADEDPAEVAAELATQVGFRSEVDAVWRLCRDDVAAEQNTPAVRPDVADTALTSAAGSPAHPQPATDALSPSRVSSHDARFDRFNYDPEALAWARTAVRHTVDRLHGFADQAATQESPWGGALSHQWKSIAAYVEQELLGYGGCVIGAFDQRLPQVLSETRDRPEPLGGVDTLARLTREVYDLTDELTQMREMLARIDADRNTWRRIAGSRLGEPSEQMRTQSALEAAVAEAAAVRAALVDELVDKPGESMVQLAERAARALRARSEATALAQGRGDAELAKARLELAAAEAEVTSCHDAMGVLTADLATQTDAAFANQATADRLQTQVDTLAAEAARTVRLRNAAQAWRQKLLDSQPPIPPGTVEVWDPCAPDPNPEETALLFAIEADEQTERPFELGDRVLVAGDPGWVIGEESDYQLCIEMEDPGDPGSPFVGHGAKLHRFENELILLVPAAADTCGTCLAPASEIDSCSHEACPTFALLAAPSPTTEKG